MFTHLYQRQHFKEAEVRVYGGEIVLALEHLHKVGEDLATCLLPWPLGLVIKGGLQTWQPRVFLSLGFLGVVGTGAASPGLLEGRPQHCLMGSPPLRSPQRGFPVTGNSGLLLGPQSQNFLKRRPHALTPKAFLKWGSSPKLSSLWAPGARSSWPPPRGSPCFCILNGLSYSMAQSHPRPTPALKSPFSRRPPSSEQ